MDLTLPSKSSPELSRYLHEPTELLPFTIYFHVPLPKSNKESLLSVCNSKLEPGSPEAIQGSSQVDLVGRSLRVAFDHQISHASSRTHDPFWFASVVHEDWRKNGVLVVALNDDENECLIDKVFLPAEVVGLSLVNLQIGNVAWGELKEEFNEFNSADNFRRDHLNTSKDDYKSSPEGRPTALEELQNLHISREDQEHMTLPTSKYFLDYWIALYVVEDFQLNSIYHTLGRWAIPNLLTQMVFIFRGRVSETNPIEDAVHLHLEQKERYDTLCQGMFIVADRKDIENEGVALVRIEHEQRELEQPKLANFETQRLPAHYQNTFLTFHDIFKGNRPWTFVHWAFLIHTGNRISPYVVEEMIDKRYLRRTQGDERVLAVVGSYYDEAFEKANLWTGAVKRHPVQCARERFRANLNRHLFIFCDGGVPQSADDNVYLVNIDWDGDIHRSPAELWNLDLTGKVSWSAIPLRNAYGMLSAVANGQKAWRGSPAV